jgi:hypothetical protein
LIYKIVQGKKELILKGKLNTINVVAIAVDKGVKGKKIVAAQ